MANVPVVLVPWYEVKYDGLGLWDVLPAGWHLMFEGRGVQLIKRAVKKALVYYPPNSQPNWNDTTKQEFLAFMNDEIYPAFEEELGVTDGLKKAVLRDTVNGLVWSSVFRLKAKKEKALKKNHAAFSKRLLSEFKAKCGPVVDNDSPLPNNFDVEAKKAVSTALQTSSLIYVAVQGYLCDETDSGLVGAFVGRDTHGCPVSTLAEFDLIMQCIYEDLQRENWQKGYFYGLLIFPMQPKQ